MLASHVGPWAGGVAAVVRCVDPVRDPVRPVLVPGPPYVGVCRLWCCFCLDYKADWCSAGQLCAVPQLVQVLFRHAVPLIHPLAAEPTEPAARPAEDLMWSGRTSGSPSNKTKKRALSAQQLSRVRPIPTTVCPLGDRTSGVVRSNRCRQAGWAGRGAPPPWVQAATG